MENDADNARLRDSNLENSIKPENLSENEKPLNFLDRESESSEKLPDPNSAGSSVYFENQENLKSRVAISEEPIELNFHNIELNYILDAATRETNESEESKICLKMKKNDSLENLPIVDDEFIENEATVAVTIISQDERTIENSVIMKNISALPAESICPLSESKNSEKTSLSDVIASPAKLETESTRANIAKEAKNEKPITSLDFLARAYENSDSDGDEPRCVYEEKTVASDEERRMEVEITKEYRNKPVVESSNEESDEDSSEEEDSTSSEDSSDVSDEGNENCREKNERNRNKAAQEKETKGEYDDLPPIEELKISVPEVLCDPLGEVGWMVEQLVVVKPKSGKPTLNLDTILFVERGRRVLGRIFDVFGQVSEPHYCVRFNSTDHIKESDIKVGMIVYFCPNTEYTSVVFLHDLLKMKATDEIGDDEHPEFSDDEEERAYYAANKQKQKIEKMKNSEVPQKRQRTDGQDSSWKSNHPWSTGKKQQHTKKSLNTHKMPEWSLDRQQIVAPRPSNFWQYQNRHGQPANSHGFFRPPWISYPPRHEPRMSNNRFYQRPVNSTRFPNQSFPWPPQTPGQSGFPWSLPPPPPPGT